MHNFKQKSPGYKLLKSHVLRDHVSVGLVFALVLSQFWNWTDCFIFWLSSILVDMDHYLNMVYWTKFKCLSPTRTFEFHSHIVDNGRRIKHLSIEIFHTIEFIALIYLLAFVLGVGLLKPVFWGIVFHVFVDLAHLYRINALTSRSHSVVDYMIRSRDMERKGSSASISHQLAAKAMGDGC